MSSKGNGLDIGRDLQVRSNCAVVLAGKGEAELIAQALHGEVVAEDVGAEVDDFFFAGDFDE